MGVSTDSQLSLAGEDLNERHRREPQQDGNQTLPSALGESKLLCGGGHQGQGHIGEWLGVGAGTCSQQVESLSCR